MDCYSCSYYNICKFVEAAKLLKSDIIKISDLKKKLKCKNYKEEQDE